MYISCLGLDTMHNLLGLDSSLCLLSRPRHYVIL
nr:MAG TPA: hypothetical protein [Inoviridae sp.]